MLRLHQGTVDIDGLDESKTFETQLKGERGVVLMIFLQNILQKNKNIKKQRNHWIQMILLLN